MLTPYSRNKKIEPFKDKYVAQANVDTKLHENGT
jgi:hypothetical protein